MRKACGKNWLFWDGGNRHMDIVYEVAIEVVELDKGNIYVLKQENKTNNGTLS